MSTTDEPVVIDYHHTNLRDVAKLDHVHDLDGTCMKRRAGERCGGPWVPVERLELEPGDTGQAILPAPSVKDQGAYPGLGYTEREAVDALAWLAGYAPDLYARALRRARGDFS